MEQRAFPSLLTGTTTPVSQAHGIRQRQTRAPGCSRFTHSRVAKFTPHPQSSNGDGLQFSAIFAPALIAHVGFGGYEPLKHL